LDDAVNLVKSSEERRHEYMVMKIHEMEKGITKGTTDTTFSPNDSCTRGQIVTFLYRAMS